MAKKRRSLKLNYDVLLEQSVMWGRNILRILYDDYIPDNIRPQDVEINDYKGEHIYVEYVK